MCRPPFYPIRTIAVVAACALASGGSALAVDITVGTAIAGSTPEIIGYNSGHFMPDSNTADWWRYSGVNGARVWPTPSVVEGSDDNGVWGDGVDSQAGFLARRSALRADPLNTTFINWPHFEDRYENNPTSGANIINLKYAFGKLHELGVQPVVEINRTNAGYPWDAAGTSAGWADRWEHWQHFYAQAFYLARHFDVQRFQMYNEPNHTPDITQAQYVERLQFASDAVQAAVEDVNALYGKALDPQMQAPVTAGGTSVYNSWGAPVLDNLHTNFLGVVDPQFKLIDTYAYQQYNASGETFGSQLSGIKSLVNGAAPGQDIRFAITEFNVHTASTFDSIPETLDTPSKSSRLGSILANLANNRPDELYIFKFSQGPGAGASGVKKNGTHYVDNDDGPYNIGGITKGGEVVRLFAKGFAGANDLFGLPLASGSGAADLRLAAARNNEQDRYFLLSANEAAASRTLSIDLSRWSIQPGSRVIVEEVSADRHGEVSHVFTVPSNRSISFVQSPQSVVLLSIPKAPSVHNTVLAANDDTLVQAGSNAAATFGDSPNLYAMNDSRTPSDRSVSFIKFDTGPIANSEIQQAVLTVTGENVGTDSQVIAHVYGILDDDWDESTLNWNSAPNLPPSVNSAINDISHNFIEGVGDSAFFVGNMTGIAASRELALDVTTFLQNHPDQQVTFLIAREVRFEGENVDHDLTALRLASKENGAELGPQLALSLSGFALPGDYDLNGVVDSGDFDAWAASVGSPTNSFADGNRNGTVDAADYIIWRKNLGNVLPGTGSAIQSLLAPEPSSACIGCLAIMSLVSCVRCSRADR